MGVDTNKSQYDRKRAESEKESRDSTDTSALLQMKT